MNSLTKFFFVSLVFVFLLQLVFAASCGNGSCETGENKCNCSLDCGKCEGDVEGLICQEYTCRTGDCEPTLKMNCCGNGICEGGESSANCISDCEARVLSMQVLSPEPMDWFPRGSMALIKTRLRTEFDVALTATVLVESSLGSTVLYDDGVHGDDLKDDGVYANSIIIPKDGKEGNYDLKLKALLGAISREEVIQISLKPVLDLSLETEREEFALSEIIIFEGVVQRKGQAISEEVNIRIVSDNNELVFEESTISNDQGDYIFNYQSSLLDPAGKWSVVVESEDKFYNKGAVEKKINLVKSAEVNYFGLKHLLPTEGIYRRGEKLQVLVEITKGTELEGVILKTTLPGGRVVTLEEITPGKYGGNIFFGSDIPLGKQEIITTAIKDKENVRLSGSSSVSVKIVQADILLEMLKPSKSNFEFGDTIEFEFRLTYDSGEPVNNADLNFLVNNEQVELKQVAEGVYAGSYGIFESSDGKLFFSLVYSDRLGNTGQKEFTLNVLGTSLTYWLVKRQLLVIVIVLTLLFLIWTYVPPALKRFMVKKSEEKISRLQALESDLQEHYFKKGTISREDYDKLIDSYKLQIEKYRDQIDFWTKLIPERKKSAELKARELVKEKQATEAEQEVKEQKLIVEEKKPSRIAFYLSLFLIIVFGRTTQWLWLKAYDFLEFREKELKQLQEELKTKFEAKKISDKEFAEKNKACSEEVVRLLDQKKLLDSHKPKSLPGKEELK